MSKTKNQVKIHNKVAERLNSETEEINSFYDNKNGGSDWVKRLGTNSKEYQEYIEAYMSKYSQYYTEECIKMFGERPV